LILLSDWDSRYQERRQGCHEKSVFLDDPFSLAPLL
jgi:hypothetical protein